MKPLNREVVCNFGALTWASIGKSTGVDLSYIYYGATSFKQDISSWNFKNVTNLYQILRSGPTLSTAHYVALLKALYNAWAVDNNSLRTDVYLGVDSFYDSSAVEVRAALINSKGWHISDFGEI